MISHSLWIIFNVAIIAVLLLLAIYFVVKIRSRISRRMRGVIAFAIAYIFLHQLTVSDVKSEGWERIAVTGDERYPNAEIEPVLLESNGLFNMNMLVKHAYYDDEFKLLDTEIFPTGITFCYHWNFKRLDMQPGFAEGTEYYEVRGELVWYLLFFTVYRESKTYSGSFPYQTHS